MEEISSKAKILLFFDAIAAFIFTFLYLIIPELYASLIDPLVFDPYYWRAFGATVLVLGIFAIRAAMGKKEQALFMFEIIILWSFVILLLNFWELIVLPLSPTYTETTWFDSILLIVLIVLNTTIYFQEKK